MIHRLHVIGLFYYFKSISDLNKVYTWASVNNKLFNDNKNLAILLITISFSASKNHPNTLYNINKPSNKLIINSVSTN